jgi:hypothetical protein
MKVGATKKESDRIIRQQECYLFKAFSVQGHRAFCVEVESFLSQKEIPRERFPKKNGHHGKSK